MKLRLALLSAWIMISGCKTSDAPTSETAGAATPKSADTNCSDPTQINAADLSGEKIFDLTERCVFNEQLHTVKIRILSETYQKILDDGCAGIDSGYGQVIELDIDGQRIENVGMKVRGNTSRCNLKRQFKFKFDETELFSKNLGTIETKKFPANRNRHYFGLESISVRASANDPSMVREKVSSDIFAAVNRLAPASERRPTVYRLAPAKVFVSFNRRADEGPEGTFTRLMDGYYYDYKGYYSLAENLDRWFLASRFQKGNTPLNQASFIQADLGLASLERSTYKPEGWSLSILKGNKVKTEAQRVELESMLFKLIDLIAKKPSDAELEKAINVDGTINYMVAANLAGHWDSLLCNANNDGLYFDGSRWQPITWDLDNSLGTNYAVYKSLMSSDPHAPAIQHPNPLFSLILSPEHSFRARFDARLKAAMDGAMSAQEFDKAIDHWSATVKDNAEDWEGYRPELYNDMKNFMASRRDNFSAQIGK